MKLTEIYRPRQSTPRYNPTAEVPLVLQHPDYDGEDEREDWFAEPMVNVEFTIDPGDPSVGWQGGADEIQGITAAEPFSFMGNRFEEGQPIPDELLQYWDPSRGYKQGDVMQYLLDRAEENYDGEPDDGDYELDRRRDAAAEEWAGSNR